MKKLLFFIIIAASVFAYPQNLKNSIDALFNGDFYSRTVTAVEAYDLTADTILYRKNEKLLLHPASNMKILTSAAALLFLGGGYNFTTELYYSGTVKNDTLFGNVYVKGGFDPDFNLTDLDTFVSVIKKSGIKVITGNLCGDVSAKDSLFWGSGWMWDDDPSTDAPYLSALNINKNSASVFVSPTVPGSPPEVTLVPATKYIDIKNLCTTAAPKEEENFAVTRDWLDRSNEIRVMGKIKIGTAGTREPELKRVNIYKPELYFLTLFQETLNKHGIQVKDSLTIKEVPGNTKPECEYKRNIDSIIIRQNKISDNLSAEMLLYAVAGKYYGKPASAKNGLLFIDSLVTLAGFNPQNYRFADGSGVSHYNLVTAELLLGVLKYVYKNHPGIYKILKESFPLAGFDGTLSNRMLDTPAYKNVSAKTGTLSGISALSGYLTAANGHQVAFSILVQNYAGSSAETKVLQDKICTLLAGYK